MNMYRLASTRIRYKQAHSVAEHHGPGPSRRYSKRQKYATTKCTGPISADGVVVGYPGLHLLCPLLVVAAGRSELQMKSYQSYNPKNEGIHPPLTLEAIYRFQWMVCTPISKSLNGYIKASILILILTMAT